MSNEIKSIHEFEVQLICEYFTGLDRQGPGSSAVTRQALSYIDNLTADSQIADLGCGTGGQTMTLAESAPGKITGVDFFPDFIRLFNEQAKAKKLDDRVKGVVGDMATPPFEEESLDLIWSEGAIYNIGYANGLKMWNKYLRKGGFVAVSEASWFTDERPQEITDFWVDAYPEIDIISTKVRQMEEAGYIPVAHFILSEDNWIEHFYAPMEPVMEQFLHKYKDHQMAKDLINSQKHEMELYHKYKEYYGYVFFIGKKM